MSAFPTRAEVVVIGAGIVGNSIVGHLADMGWTDIVLLDKGPLPNPGGSTGHASNFIFPTDHNREMAELTVESQRQYEEAGFNTECGGIEVARTEERMEELRRRMTSAKAYGIEATLVTPAEIKELVPFIEEDVIVGGFYTPSVSVVDSLGYGTHMRDKARDMGALQVFGTTEVLDLETESVPHKRPRISAVVTDKGRIEADHVVVACGVWSPRIAEMAGASIPLTPAVHQMADVGPIDVLQATGNEIGYPIVRDMDTFMYERQSAGSMEVGSYAHRPIFHHPDEIPSNDEAALSPTEMPFTQEDFDPQLEDALEIMGGILETAEIRYAINGLLSLTPDAMPVLGETVEVENLWSAAAVWIKEGPAIGQLMAEWMTHGYPHIADPHGSDIARFYPHEKTEHHVLARAAEHFNKTYGIVHPREQWETERGMNRAPFAAREEELGAVFYDARGWERPQWYESNAELVERYGIPDREHEWDRRWWSPIILGEHLHMREKVAMVDLTAFQIFDVSGPGVVDYIEMMTVNKCDRPVGSAIYTPVLEPGGGFRSDLTVLRLADDRFRVVTGAFDGGRDEYWFRTNLPDDGSVHFENRTSAMTTIGVWGPKAIDLLSKVCEADLSQDAFPYATVQDTLVDGIPVTMFRISYVGESGFEVYTPMQHGLRLWDTLWEAGQEFEVRPAGIGVYGTTGRIEKGYRLMGAELESEYTPVEAGLARPRVKQADFIGKAAYLQAREEDPAAVLCTLTMDDHTSESGVKRYPTGGNEPILTLEGERIVDAKGRPSRVTTAGSGPSLGAYLLMAYLPPEYAQEGRSLQVMYMNETYPVTVARVGSQPLFDPDDERMKA
ncbi:MAG: FAD-dependent oxidoreductase [Acidimicrobiia bacterium]|nr:FAD-dependent oxidoreductase [Acidimicrobiia bacterium]